MTASPSEMAFVPEPLRGSVWEADAVMALTVWGGQSSPSSCACGVPGALAASVVTVSLRLSEDETELFSTLQL